MALYMHEPLHLDIVACMAPVTLHVEVSEWGKIYELTLRSRTTISGRVMKNYSSLQRKPETRNRIFIDQSVTGFRRPTGMWGIRVT